MKYWRLSSSAMPAVAGSRSRADTMISVRPPLSSVMRRSRSTLTRSDPRDGALEFDAGGGLGGRAFDPDDGRVDPAPGVVPGNADGMGAFLGADAAGGG